MFSAGFFIEAVGKFQVFASCFGYPNDLEIRSDLLSPNIRSLIVWEKGQKVGHIGWDGDGASRMTVDKDPVCFAFY